MLLRPLTLALVATVVVSVGCGDALTPAHPAGAARLPAGDPQHAGVAVGGLLTTAVDEGCADCHPEVVEAYRTSAMHRSLTLPSSPGTPEAAVVGHTVIDPESGIEAAFDVDEDAYVQRIRYRAPDGSVLAEHSWPVDLVVGSGRAARSYFSVQDGVIFQLPLTWYRELDGLALSPGPGYRDAALRFAPRVCVECHTGRVTPRSLVEELGFEGEISLGIACSRCHGDGSAHSLTGDPREIVNPARLDLQRQSEVCYQCHLSGDLTLSVPGQSTSEFRPGEELGRRVAIFGAARDVSAGAPISGHAARLAQSKCATGDVSLTCTTCHNPHAPAASADTQGGCGVCHATEECSELPSIRAAATCTSCHLRRVPASDIEHTSTTDHLIARRPPPPPARVTHDSGGALAALAADDAPLTNLLDPQSGLPDAHLRLAHAYLTGADAAAAMGAPYRPYLVRARDQIAAAAETGSGGSALALLEARYLRATDRPAQAREIAAALLRDEPDSIAALTEVGQSSARMNDLQGVIVHLGRALELHPHGLHLVLTLAEAHRRAGHTERAAAVLAAAIERLGPSVPLSSRALDACEQAGLVADAVRHGLDLLIYRPRDAALRERVARLAERVGNSEALVRSLRSR